MKREANWMNTCQGSIRTWYCDSAQGCHDHDQIGLGGFDVVILEHPFGVANDERGKVVETLAYTLEHDQAEWNADQCVDHREEFTTHSVRCGMAVAWMGVQHKRRHWESTVGHRLFVRARRRTDSRQHGGSVIKRAGEFPLTTGVMGRSFEHYELHHPVIIASNAVPPDDHLLHFCVRSVRKAIHDSSETRSSEDQATATYLEEPRHFLVRSRTRGHQKWRRRSRGMSACRQSTRWYGHSASSSSSAFFTAVQERDALGWRWLTPITLSFFVIKSS